jgi:hypothetical protein
MHNLTAHFEEFAKTSPIVANFGKKRRILSFLAREPYIKTSRILLPCTSINRNLQAILKKIAARGLVWRRPEIVANKS